MIATELVKALGGAKDIDVMYLSALLAGIATTTGLAVEAILDGNTIVVRDEVDGTIIVTGATVAEVTDRAEATGYISL